MTNEFQNTNINVIKVEAKMASTGNMRYILTAQDNKKYFFYQKNKGVDCDVYQTFVNMEVKQGSTIAIGFVEEAKSFQNPKGEIVNYTDRFISSMREAQGVPSIKGTEATDAQIYKKAYEAAGRPVQAPVTPKSAPQAPLKTEYVAETKDEKFWDKKAYKQCLWNYWLEQGVPNMASKFKVPLDPIEMDLVWKVFNQIDEDANKRFNPSIEPQSDIPPLEEYPNF